MEHNVDLFGEKVLDAKRNMRDFFIVPPFSIINTMDEGWQRRRQRWLKITGDLTETKEKVLAGGGDNLITKINNGSSNFDPVLAEVILKWFNLPGGHMLDPFGGEQTKGVVCGELGYKYSGVEFREDQCKLNTQLTAGYNDINYYNGDSNNIDKIIMAREFDICFTSPPYYDLEVYSADDMSGLGTYEEFMSQYKNIFKQCVDMLAPNRFLIVKVCEIRNKKSGEYRNFVGDNITLFKELGLKYYNEIILLNSPGTLPLRAGKFMNASRKIGKQHQNILVFFKGDLQNINKLYGDLMPKNEYYEQGDK